MNEGFRCREVMTEANPGDHLGSKKLSEASTRLAVPTLSILPNGNLAKTLRNF